MARRESQLSRLEHILLSCRRSLNGVYVAFFTIYFDDSGTNLESPVAIAAAWIAPIEIWKKFEGEYEGIKSKYGFKCLHTAELVSGNQHSEFALWDDDKKSAVIRRIVQVSLKYASAGWSIAINKKDYDDLVPTPLREKMGKYHYTWAVRSLVGFVERWREKHTLEPTEYIFDRMNNNRSDAEKRTEIESMFDSTSDSKDALHRYGIYKGCLSFRWRCDVLPLQASDLWAWTSYQRSHHQVTSKPVKEIAIESFNSLTHHGQACAYMCSRDQLRDFVKQQSTAPSPYTGEPPLIRVNPASLSRHR